MAAVEGLVAPAARAVHPFTLEDLTAAWREVRAAAVEEGQLTGAVLHFEHHLNENLAHLVVALAGGWFRPGDLHVARLTKSDGSLRLLHVPHVADRVVERAILDALTPTIDPSLSDAAHAYRPGRGVQSAVRAVAGLRDAGLPWIARGDVDDCFPSISPAAVLTGLSVFDIPPHVGIIIERLLGRRARAFHPGEQVRGIPQGSPLSPMFMNVVLAPFDDKLLSEGFALVRYADDFVIAAASRAAAESALGATRLALGELGLTMNEDKCDVTSFDIGFEFLGEDFGPRYPQSDPDEGRTGDPHSLFVGRQGARLRSVRGRLIIQSEDDVELLNLPDSRVGRVVLAGAVGLSAGARSWALINDVPVTFLTRSGSYLGQMVSAGSPNRLRRLRTQVQFALDTEAALQVAGTCVVGKIRKQRVVLQRTSRGSSDAKDALATMDACIESARGATSVVSLMGCEGAAAAAYFAGVGARMPVPLRFELRSRRPPADVVNAALSYGYAILLGECVAALVAAGLDPGLGLLHDGAEQDRPALALDLMEEFRPWVVDTAVFALARRGELGLEHGEQPVGREGVWLTGEGKKRLVEAYEVRMLAPANASLPGFRGSVRRCLYRQAQRLALHMADPVEHPFTDCSWR